MRLRVCAVGVAALFFGHVSAFAAPPTPGASGASGQGNDPVTAREQLKIGYTLAQGGNCPEAIPHLAESLRLDPRAITLINLADCEEKTGKLADAMVHWADARARAQAEGQKPIEEEAAARSATLEAKIPRLTITLAKTAPLDAIVERDGVALGAPSIGIALPLDPGTHTIVVKARGRADASKQVTLAESEKQSLEVDAGPVSSAPSAAVSQPTPEIPAKSSGMSPLVPIGFGVAIVGVAVGTITGIVALGKGSDVDAHCRDKKCDPTGLDAADSGKTMGTISTIGFIAGGVGAAVGVIGLLTGGKKTESKVDVGIGPTSFFLKGRF